MKYSDFRLTYAVSIFCGLCRRERVKDRGEKERETLREKERRGKEGGKRMARRKEIEKEKRRA